MCSYDASPAYSVRPPIESKKRAKNVRIHRARRTVSSAVLGDFVTSFWAPIFAALILWLVWVVAAHVRQEERKLREFLGERRVQ
jgi:protein-S-isoprenylcysteine O-methyltransferase Ste14